MGARPVVCLRHADVSRRLGAAGFIRYMPGAPGYPGVAGFDVSKGEHGVEVYDLGADGEILNPGPRMQAWGRQLVRCGYAVAVMERLYLLVTLPTDGDTYAALNAKRTQTVPERSRGEETLAAFTSDQRAAADRNARAQAALMERGRARMALDFAGEWNHIPAELKRVSAAELMAQRAALCAELGVDAGTALGCWDQLKQSNAATAENCVELSTKLRRIAAIDGVLTWRMDGPA